MIAKARVAGSAFLKRPFPALVHHFVHRLFASEQEQDGSSLGFGIGAVLAILASPGAFASILLMAKYSTLLQWLRGERIDAIRRSASDEYFFVVLSMTITGFVMVARWNRLFPERRDFANLAVLPIPIRNIFLANFAALVGLGVVFAVDVNLVSTVFFPLFVTMSYDTLSAFLRVGLAHVLAVFSASLFSFFAIFGLVGTLMLVVPRRIFGTVSVLMRMALVIGLLLEFFSNVFLELVVGHSSGQAGSYMRWLPSYWFLGIYESLLGIARPSMRLLGTQASEALAGAIVFSAAVYSICYRTWFLRLPESFDMMGGSQRLFRVKLPEAWVGRLFRSPFERACSTFAVKVLLRSEQHLMFFCAYLGIGMVMVAQSALDTTGLLGRPAYPSAGYLAVPMLIAFFVISALRFAFDMPAALEANWVFKISADSPRPEACKIARRLMLWITLPAETFLLPLLTARSFGWAIAIMQAAITVAFTVLFVQLMLVGFQKIPFTCRTAVDVKKLITRMLGTVFGVMLIVPALASMERWIFPKPLRIVTVLAGGAAAWYLLSRYRKEVEEGGCLRFEDHPREAFELLKLS